MFGTAKGSVRRNSMDAFTNVPSNGKIAMKFEGTGSDGDDDDRLIGVALLDASDDDFIVGVNPLRSAGGNGEVMVENLVGLMHSLWSHSWGPRLDDILRA